MGNVDWHMLAQACNITGGNCRVIIGETVGRVIETFYAYMSYKAV